MGVKKMKTLIEYAIAVGNENRNGFNSHFTNENPFTNENRGRNELKNENRILNKNEHGNEPRFNRRNEQDMCKQGVFLNTHCKTLTIHVTTAKTVATSK